MGRRKRAISDVYGELKERAKEVGPIINVDKAKATVQNRRHNNATMPLIFLLLFS